MLSDSKDDLLDLHKIWRETNNQIDLLSRGVAENRGVDPALNFARWLLRSGILPLLERHSGEGFWKFDGANLRWKAEELQRQCQDRYARKDGSAQIQDKDLRTIHEKLDSIAGYLSKVAGQVGPVVRNGNGHHDTVLARPIGAPPANAPDEFNVKQTCSI